MSMKNFNIHEWNKEKMDELVMYNHYSDGKKEGIEEEIEQGIKYNTPYNIPTSMDI